MTVKSRPSPSEVYCWREFLKEGPEKLHLKQEILTNTKAWEPMIHSNPLVLQMRTKSNDLSPNPKLPLMARVSSPQGWDSDSLMLCLVPLHKQTPFHKTSLVEAEVTGVAFNWRSEKQALPLPKWETLSCALGGGIGAPTTAGRGRWLPSILGEKKFHRTRLKH